MFSVLISRMDAKSQLDLYLTEISIELLGNKIYDINGKRQNRLINLFQAVPHATNESSDLLCSINDNSYNQDGQAIEFLEDQINYLLQDANSSSHVNKQIISNLQKIKSDQEKLLKDCSEFYVKRLVGKS